MKKLLATVAFLAASAAYDLAHGKPPPDTTAASAPSAQFLQAIETIGTPPFGTIRNGKWFAGGADTSAHWQLLSAECAKYEGRITQRFEHGTYEYDPSAVGGWTQVENECAGTAPN